MPVHAENTQDGNSESSQFPCEEKKVENGNSERLTVPVGGGKAQTGHSERLTVPVGRGKGTDRAPRKAHSACMWRSKHRMGTLKGGKSNPV